MDPVERDHVAYFQRPSVAGGWGSKESHFGQIDTLRASGLPLAQLKWLGTESTAQNINCPDESYDVIFDHATSEHIAYTLARNGPPVSDTLSSIFTQYKNKLRKGGKAIIAYHRKHPSGGFLKRSKDLTHNLLMESGLQGTSRDVSDRYEIPTPEGFAERLHKYTREIHDQNSTAYLLNYMVNPTTHLPDRSDGTLLYFPKPEHTCSRIFIGTKS